VQIDGSVAVVTGAGSGIGRSIAAALAAAGASVVAGDIDPDSAAQTAAMIGGVAVTVDAASAEGIATLLDTARRTFGPVDVYIANAGITGQPGLGDDETEWDRILDVNVRAHIRAAKAVLPQWLERGTGHFVAVASAAGLLTQLGAAAYSVTKHAAVGFAEWLAITYGDRGIGVSCVCPMGVETPLLRGMTDASDTEARMAGSAVVGAGAVIGPDVVAALVVRAIADGTFLVLPHPEVLGMYRQKGADYDRWIAGMRRYRARLERPEQRYQAHRHEEEQDDHR
jgi:NAD(P)-dependent dehydrogenase (short-subunit alcohol dehydrogenase family)